jgi:hypothetical protein
MSQNININNDFENKAKRENNIERSSKERKAFKNEFEKNLTELGEINDLIEKHLEIEDVDPTDALPEKEAPNSLEMKQSYADPAKIQRERMQRIGLLKSDPTGQQLKASGEDI